MISDLDAVWKADDYTPFGKWMDGWESRRRRTEGHDWCIVKLGIPGSIKAIEVTLVTSQPTLVFMLNTDECCHCMHAALCRSTQLSSLEISHPKSASLVPISPKMANQPPHWTN